MELIREQQGKKHALWNTIALNVFMFGLLKAVQEDFRWTLSFKIRKEE